MLDTTSDQNGTMLDSTGVGFKMLTKVGDLASANIIAARLRAEGIEARVHSPSLGPYPVTVGDMALSEIWVLEDRIEDASRVLLDIEAKNVVGFDEEFTPTARPDPPVEIRTVAAVVAAIVTVLFVLRLLSMF
jgi:cytochrome c-type biogenesis protein CcmH/NrfG